MNATNLPGNVFRLDFGAGRLVNIADAGLLPVGQLVTYSDRANPQKEFVVISPDFNRFGHGQECVCEDGHRSCVSRDSINGPGGWELARNRAVLTAEEIALFVATAEARKVREDAERAEATRKAGEAAAQHRAAYIANNPKLEQVKAGGYGSAALGAKNIRKELKAAFPGHKFSVTSDTFSGGNSIDIRWDLGPTTKEVEAITNKYQQGHFNSMEDIYESDRENVWPEIFGGAKYVQESRSEGEFHNVVALALCKRWDITPPEDGKSFWNICRPDDREDVGCIARQLILAQSYPVGAVLTGIEDHESEDENAPRWSRWFRVTFITPGVAAAEATPEPAPVSPVHVPCLCW